VLTGGLEADVVGGVGLRLDAEQRGVERLGGSKIRHGVSTTVMP